MTISEVIAHRGRRRPVCAGLVALTVGGMLAGCAGGSSPEPAASPAAPHKPGVTATAANPDVALCHAYAAAAPDGRAPLDAMRSEAVLVPTVDFIELSTNQIARQGVAARSPVIAAAMRELVAAQEDLDAQGHAKLPAGADLNSTTVKLNPERLAAALDAADLACAPLRSL